MDKTIESFYKKYSIVLIFLIFLILGVSYYLSNLEKSLVEEFDIAVFETNLGEFKVKLYTNESPITVNNFIYLVNENFYDYTRFHAIYSEDRIFAGDPNSRDEFVKDLWGAGGPGYIIEDEFVEGLSNIRGTISMDNFGISNSSGSRFFFNIKNNIHLDWDKTTNGKYHIVFGEVILGMDVIDQIAKLDTFGPTSLPIEEIIIYDIYIE